MGFRGYWLGLWARRKRARALALVVAVAAGCAVATTRGADALTFSYGGFDWGPDRADTASEATGSFFGRDDVLHLGIGALTTVPGGSSFYQYQGYKTLTGLPVGASFVSGDIYIPDSWSAEQALKFQSVGLWATLGIPPGTAESYPIVSFYNGPDDTAVGGAIRFWNFDHWEVIPGAPINYDGWNTFRVSYLPGDTVGGGAFQIVVNGVIVATMTGGDFTAGPIDPALSSQYEIILNARTNASCPGDPCVTNNGAYDTYWSRIMASLMEEYYAYPTLPVQAIVGGGVMLGTYTDRRGLDWDGTKASWMHAVGGGATVNDGNGGFNSGIGGAQYGIDVLAFDADAMNRAGVTFGYEYMSSNLLMPGGGLAGSSIGRNPSVGAYLTHAGDGMYADLLAQYRFLDFDVSTLTTGHEKVTGGSVDVAAEAGGKVDLGNGMTIIPFAQLVYQHVMFPDFTAGAFDVVFGDNDALIGRVRLMAQCEKGNMKAFGSVGVSSDLLGAKTTTVNGVPIETTIGGAQYELTAGFESNVGNNMYLFSSGEFNGAFDGSGQSYLARAGLRQQF